MSEHANKFIRVSRIDEIGMPHQMTFQGETAAQLSQDLFRAWQLNPTTDYVALYEYRGAGVWQKQQWVKR